MLCKVLAWTLITSCDLNSTLKYALMVWGMLLNETK